MDLNIFTLLSEVSHVDILNFVPGVVRAIAPNIYGSNVYDPSQVPNNYSIALSRPRQNLPYVGAILGYFVSIIILICCTVRERSFFKCCRTYPAIKLDVSCKCLQSSTVVGIFICDDPPCGRALFRSSV
jgi:hypothetical protein